MSSSNLVRIAVIEESTYGETPSSGNFSTSRFISETLSGSPETTESQQIRTDRMSSGQVVTGLTVGGEENFELAKDPTFDKFLESAMFNSWQISSHVALDMDLDASANTLDRAAGDFATQLKVGDIVTLDGFSNQENNTQVMITEIVSATQVKFAGPEGLVTENGSGTGFKVADKLEIGSTKKSFSMEKAFLDLSDKGIVYKGMIVSNFNLSVAYGSIITGAVGFSGNYYKPVDAAIDFITNGRTIDPAATTNSLNGSVDMPFVANGATGTFEKSTFCIQSVDISLNNNLTTQNCVGKVAPKDYNPGTAQIEVGLGAYLADGDWGLLAKKLSQESFPVGFLVKNGDGFYGFYMPAVQVSFDDPASQGQNQDVIMDMKGTAKVGSNGESALVIYKS